MKVGERKFLQLLAIVCTFLYSGLGVTSLSYDYTASSECLAKPYKAQYGGGIITNPEFDDGLKGWSNFGNAKIQHRESHGNKFLVARNRNQTYDSVSQKLYLQKDHINTFSAWMRVSSGNKVEVRATFKTTSGFQHAGSVLAESHCWSFLKGGLSVDTSGPVELYFESEDTSVEIWVDSISLQPFTQSQWKAHQHQSIEKVRKSMVRIKIVDDEGQSIPNATITMRMSKPTFPFGCATNNNLLTNSTYREWFISRGFTVTTFENEMKWYSNEPNPGKEDYSDADAMIQILSSHNITIRGHNIFWDDPTYQPYWVKTLVDSPQLSEAVEKRQNSVMSRYKGKVIAWDVVNENMHNGFFEGKLGRNASAEFYHWAFRADPGTTMFLNEYNTIEEPRDARVSPGKYVEKVREIQNFPGNERGKIGIGVEGHFGSGSPNLGYVRSAIDVLASTGLPVWITELDVQNSPNQAKYLEEVLRELHSHPRIKGIVMWSAWKPQGCWQMCLTDNNFNNLPTGLVVDKLLREWGYYQNTLNALVDASGTFQASLFHGDYDLEIAHRSTLSFQSSITVGPSTKLGSTTMLIQA